MVDARSCIERKEAIGGVILIGKKAVSDFRIQFWPEGRMSGPRELENCQKSEQDHASNPLSPYLRITFPSLLTAFRIPNTSIGILSSTAGRAMSRSADPDHFFQTSSAVPFSLCTI